MNSVVNGENIDIPGSAEDLAELEKLESIIDKYSDLVTKTRMNSDFVPGILTVVTRNEMEIAGFKTVEEVLSAMAGMHIYIDGFGFRTISVRGIGGATASGNIKMMLNNNSMTDSITSLSDFLLDYPVALLERIEIVRGPGAAVYGEYAYTGVINVVTRKTDSIVSLGIGSISTLSGSALLNYYSQDQSTHLSALVHKFKTDGSDATTGPDAYHSQGLKMKAASLAPGPTNEKQQGSSMFLSLKHNNTSCKANISQLYRGDSMGCYHYLYNLRDDTPQKIRQQAFQLSQTIEIHSQLKSILKLGWNRYRYFSEHMYLYPPIYPWYPDGLEFHMNVIERKKYANLDVSYVIDSHRFLLGLEYTEEKHIFSGITDMYRHIYSLVSQYESQPFEKFSLTLGLRYDNYDDTDNSFSPRIAGVYRLLSNHVFKCQYQAAFRPPTTGERFMQQKYQQKFVWASIMS